MNARDIRDIISAAIPNAGDDLCEHILWARTPFPVGRVSARDLYKSASSFHRAALAGRTLCEWCTAEAAAGEIVCSKCRAAFDAHRGSQ